MPLAEKIERAMNLGAGDTRTGGTWLAALRLQLQIVYAVILRDMRTRFGHTHLSYLVAIIWPLSHLVFVLGSFLYAKRVAPIGTNTTVFFATGVLPYMLCLYPARMMMYAVEQNRPVLVFPNVKVIDLIWARATVEVLSAVVVTIIFCLSLVVLDIEFWPEMPIKALEAILACIYYGVSTGILNVIIFTLFKFWGVIFILMMILAYLTSGVLMTPDIMSENMLKITWYNPLFHCVEWLRSAFYEGYGDTYLSRSYLLGVSTWHLFLGLVGERMIRGRVLQS